MTNIPGNATGRFSTGQYFHMFTHLTAREFKLRYRRSFLGWVWVVIQPLARIAVVNFVFGSVLKSQIDNFAAFLFAGLLAWQLFSSGLMAMVSSPINSSDLMRRPGIPKAMTPLVAMGSAIIDYFVTLPVYVLFFLATGGEFHIAVLWVVPLFLLEVLFTLGLGYGLAALNVFVRDTRLLVELVLFLGVYATPMFYKPSSVPERFQWIVQANPMTGFVDTQRAVLTTGTPPTTSVLVQLVVVTVVALLIGLRLFSMSATTMVDEL
jgi:lipopolysaccharide transport system permease protein